MSDRSPPPLLPELGPGQPAARRTFQTDQGWVVECDGQDSASCPDCHALSRSRHSRYWRSLRDLPLQGTPVLLRLRLSRWRCRNPACLRRLFPELPPPQLCGRYARQTRRFSGTTSLVAHALGGRPGERLTAHLGLPTSADTLLRQLKSAARRASIPDTPVGVVGVDDWAWRKGHDSFGTILVDLEASTVVDLLPVRSADALAAWLGRRPTVEVVSRDRQGLYAEGARRGAPQAQQVADRFHLVFNLTQAVERAPSLQRRHLHTAPPPSPSGPSTVPTVPTSSTRQDNTPIRRPFRPKGRSFHRAGLKRQQEIARLRRQQKLELFANVKRLQANGLRVSEIARRLELSRPRLDRWVRLESLPERSRMLPRPGMPEVFRDYLRRRWQEGCQHGPTLLAEVQARGYRGCYSGFAKLLSPWRQRLAEQVQGTTVVAPSGEAVAADLFDAPSTDPGANARQISPQRAAALLSKPRPELTPAQAAVVDTLKERCPGYVLMRRLVMSFRTLLRLGRPATLHRWMERAKNSGIAALVGFVQTLKEDLSAVEAAVGSRWSNGPVEGHVNRLKTLKRQMYGRAGVELLRARLRPVPAFDFT